MPQGRKSFEELLRQSPPAPSPTPARPSFEDLLRQPSAPTFEELLAQPPQPTQDDFLTRLRKNVGLAYEQGVESLKGKAASLGELLSGVVTGDFQPLREATEIVGRSALPLLAAGANAQGPGAAFSAMSASQQAPIEAVEQRQAARRASAGDFSFQQRAQRQAQLEQQAQAYDPSLGGRITRGAVRETIKLAPQIVTGMATGGSGAAIAAATALSSLDEPQNLITATGLSALPVPGARAAKSALAPAVERVLGRGAAQIVEQEAAGATRGAVQQTLPGLGPAVQEMLPGMESAFETVIKQEAAKVSPSILKQAVSELGAFPRAMMSSLDISAPGRQGLLLSVAPSRWGASIKAGGRMFAAFRKESYDKITRAIANDVDAPLAEQSGLYLAMKSSEEFFTSKLAGKVPGVNASQRAYETYLDSLRMSTFKQYARIVEKAGLDAAQTTKALEASAKWINVATGRGSLGKRFDDAVPLLSQFLFAPRYTASRLNVLNPVMYAKNYLDPATRVVAKQQMKDLAQYLTAVATTFGLAKAAGFDVGLNPDSGDFLKIRAGNKTYDPGAGLTQLMRFAIRASYGLFRTSKGEKVGYGQDVPSLTERFVRSKLAPIPSYVWDFLSRRTYEGREFTSGKARAQGVLERAVPLTWSDFTSALWNEGLGSAAATLPGAIGVGVQNYAKPDSFIERAQPLLSEYTRAGRTIPEIHRLKGEADEQFQARVKVHGEALERYGLDLVNSDEYKNSSAELKKRALDLLPRRINGALLKGNESWQLAPRVIMSDVRDSQQNRR